MSTPVGTYNGRHVGDFDRIGLCHKTEDSMQCAPNKACLSVYEVSKTGDPKTTAMCFGVNMDGLAHNVGLFQAHGEEG